MDTYHTTSVEDTIFFKEQITDYKQILDKKFRNPTETSYQTAVKRSIEYARSSLIHKNLTCFSFPPVLPYNVDLNYTINKNASITLTNVQERLDTYIKDLYTQTLLNEFATYKGIKYVCIYTHIFIRQDEQKQGEDLVAHNILYIYGIESNELKTIMFFDTTNSHYIQHTPYWVSIKDIAKDMIKKSVYKFFHYEEPLYIKTYMFQRNDPTHNQLFVMDIDNPYEVERSPEIYIKPDKRIPIRHAHRQRLRQRRLQRSRSLERRRRRNLQYQLSRKRSRMFSTPVELSESPAYVNLYYITPDTYQIQRNEREIFNDLLDWGGFCQVWMLYISNYFFIYLDENPNSSLYDTVQYMKSIIVYLEHIDSDVIPSQSPLYYHITLYDYFIHKLVEDSPISKQIVNPEDLMTYNATYSFIPSQTSPPRRASSPY